MAAGYHLVSLEVRDSTNAIVATYAGKYFADLLPSAPVISPPQYPILTLEEFNDEAVAARIKTFMDGLCPGSASLWLRRTAGSLYVDHYRGIPPFNHGSSAAFAYFEPQIRRTQRYSVATREISHPLCTYQETGYTKIKSFRKYVLP